MALDHFKAWFLEIKYFGFCQFKKGLDNKGKINSPFKLKITLEMLLE